MGYVRKIYVGGSMVAEVGRGVLLEMGLKSDWWRAVNRIAMDYNLDGVYYMLKYRRLPAEGKRLARIPDEWVEEMAKEKMERKVKHRVGEVESKIERYREDKKICRREERSENGERPLGADMQNYIHAFQVSTTCIFNDSSAVFITFYRFTVEI
ncbi:hypothetical protein CAPTEDRAFT_209475 [Capitella teleta]|uniref:Uncharacterized protein n=1 Tax=Capitella teleta TaxID=283909 RepID=R7UG91_CAPTE|nr:hypothetical protein CAPTEDRAFT_209475 [Capitella teleta]|eukprot:ELU02312.1 hypothetical protein CAPTEDRAFT_209475 [Capitella teleta]